MQARRSTRFWWFVLLTAAAVLPRLPLVQAGFSIEDPMYVDLASASDGLVSGVLDPWPIGFYRPFVSLHFEICQTLFGEWEPGYHVISIAVHVVVVWLVFLLCSKLTRCDWPALCGALGFAMLPVLNEAIAWTASIGDLWAAVFVIAAVLLALAATEAREGSGQWIWMASLAAMVLGCAAKETAVVAALLTPVAIWLFGRRRPSWGWTATYPAVAIAYVSWHATRVEGPGVTALFDLNPWPYIVTMMQNLMMMLVPFERNTVGDWMWNGQAMTRVVTIGGLVVLGLLVARALRRTDRTAVFGWLWAVAAFVPVCWLPWAERYAYVPAVGVALVATAALNRVRERRTVAVTVVLIAVLAVFAAGSTLSAYQWTRMVGRYVASAQNRSSAAAQWNPAPKAVSRTRSPEPMRP